MHISLTRLTLLLALILAACGRVEAPVASTPAPAATFPPSAPTPTLPPTPVPAKLTVLHRSGQTFLTWPERADLAGERYRVYRSSAPIEAGGLVWAQLLAQVGEESARVWANYYVDNGVWAPRLAERFIIEDHAAPLPAGTGALVWTLDPSDFDGEQSGTGYYAVTVIPEGGGETFDPAYTAGPVEEAVADPLPVDITHSPGIKAGSGGHFYLQYADLRHYNATFHAPNETNQRYGFDPEDPGVAHALAYTYDYSVFEPAPELCGGEVPEALPVMVFLHGARGNRYPTPENYIYPYCAYGVYPVDQSETWYFGFARDHDYRRDLVFAEGDVIVNYTEQRVLRMVYDLMRRPPGPAVDPQRVYLFGHSMGGTGALAFAQRYPNVFAAIYSGQPVTHFYATEGYDETWPTNLATKWGSQALNLPISLSAPNGWADHLQQYNGVGVFTWEDLRAAFDPAAVPNRAGDEMVLFGVDHGTADDSVLFPTQGQPLYPLLQASPRAWAGGINEAPHEWSVFGWPLPALGKVDDAPFWGLRVVRDETVPGFSRLSGTETGLPAGPTTYNQTVLWSASWNAWDGAPVDEPGEWRMSFCAVEAGAGQCGGGQPVTVDITPRRLQRFTVTPGEEYAWENARIADGQVVAGGTVVADANGLVTAPGVQVSPEGNRLRIWRP